MQPSLGSRRGVFVSSDLEATKCAICGFNRITLDCKPRVCDCRDLGADRVLAWPTAEIAVMGAEGAAEIVFRREIDAAEDHQQRRQELIDLYRNTFSNPFVSAGTRLVDDVY